MVKYKEVEDFNFIQKGSWISLDTETRKNPLVHRGFYGDIRVVQVTLLNEPDMTYLKVFNGHDAVPHMQHLAECKWIGQNINYDVYSAERMGVDVSRLEIHDTLIMAHNAVPHLKSFSLDALYEALFGVDVYKEYGLEKKALQASQWDEPELTKEQLTYAALDTQAALKVYFKLAEMLSTMPQARISYEVGRLAQTALFRAIGFAFDAQEAQKQGYFTPKYELPKGMKLRSSKQKCEWLNLPPMLNSKGDRVSYRADKYVLQQIKVGKFPYGAYGDNPKWNALALAEIGRPEFFHCMGYEPYPKDWKSRKEAYELHDQYERYIEEQEHCDTPECREQRRKATVLLDAMNFDVRLSFLDVFRRLALRGRRVNSVYRVTTTSGRTAAQGHDYRVNIQQAPRSVKPFFKASAAKVLVTFDYSQLELRMMACLAEDKVMYEAYKNREDLHNKTKIMLGLADRSLAKRINFGVMYLMAENTFHGTMLKDGGIDWEGSSGVLLPLWYIKEVIEKFRATYTGVAQLQDYVKELTKKGGGYLTTVLGRQLHHCTAPQLIGRYIQGSAAEVAKVCLAYQEKGVEAPLCAMVHDSFTWETTVSEADKVARQAAEVGFEAWRYAIKDTAFPDMPMPIEVGMGVTWKEADSNVIYVKD